MGRPSTYTDDLAQEICERISKGEPLEWICEDDHMPAVRTVSDWKKAHESFSADFACARDEGFDALAAGILRIIDDKEEDPASRRVRAEYRLKLLAKWDPKRYGELLKLGGDERTPLKVFQAAYDDQL